MDQDIQQEPQADFVPERVYKNHFSTVVQSLVSALVIVIIMGLVWHLQGITSISELSPMMFLLAGIVAVTLFVSIRIWLKTVFMFGDTELRVEKNTLFRTAKNIQYSKMASVNVRRTIVNHIFGTTTLMFNVNSSVNSTIAEATLTLRQVEADELREFVSSKILKKEMVIEEERHQETLVNVSNMDVILHGFFGQPTASSIFGLIMLAYSIITTITNSGGALVAIILFAISTVYPWIRTILRYYNYRIYRVDDTITVESGLISNYRSSFNIKRVNSIRIREPLLARLMGKSVLEAEVVGLADTEGRPLLCPLKSKKTVDDLAQQLVPEFLFETSDMTQPRQSFVPTMMIRVLAALVFLAAGLVLYFYVTSHYQVEDYGYLRYVFYIAVASLCAIAPLLLIVNGLLAQGHREFEMGEETFFFVTGAYDRQREFIRYDKVQVCSVTSGIIQRRFGVGRCTVSLMSSGGAARLMSGIFDRDELEKVSDEVMARISDGRYDYRRYL